MKVLVTGANGFLGSWLTKHLLEEGHDVSALVRKSSDLSELATVKPNYVYGDVTNPDSLKEHFKGKEVIYNLAGVVAYKKSERAKMELVNVQGTANVVKACVDANIPKLLHLSSVVAIGAQTKPIPMTEETKYNIAHLHLGYFDTKHKAEQIVMAAGNGGHLHAICVNPSTIYGFGDAKKGSRRTQIKVAQGKFKYYTTGGVNVVPVEDVIRGIQLAVKKGRSGQRYILCSENMLIKDLFKKIAGFAGVPAPDKKLPGWALHLLGLAGDTLERAGINIGMSGENAYAATLFHWFDCQKAKQELGFAPTSADKAIENSVKWMRDNKYI